MNEHDKKSLAKIISRLDNDKENGFDEGFLIDGDHYFNATEELLRIIRIRADHRVHVDVIGEEITKLRKLLNRSYEMISKLMPGIGGLVIDIGELNSLMIAIKLAKDNPPPETPVKHGRIFGGT
jgi:hypothetical protein